MCRREARSESAGEPYPPIIDSTRMRGDNELAIGRLTGRARVVLAIHAHLRVTAGHAAFALYQTRGFEIIEYLFQEALGNVLLIGDSLNAHQRLVVIQT